MIKRLITKIMPVAALFFAGALLAAGQTGPVHVPLAQDLAEDAALAEQGKLPVLLMFSAEHCSYCEEVEASFLRPMLISGDYTDKVLIRKVRIDDYGRSLTDFDGSTVSPADLASRYHVRVTPTLVFLDSHGNQLTSKLVGISSVDYYGSYLDGAIDTALDRLRRDRPLVARIQ